MKVRSGPFNTHTPDLAPFLKTLESFNFRLIKLESSNFRAEKATTLDFGNDKSILGEVWTKESERRKKADFVG